MIDEKAKHPSVPVVAIFNPSSGPGGAKDSTIASWVAKLRNVGVVAIGYTYDNYGTRSLYDLNRDADKYKNWYGADGLFIDEFTNKVGFENHYRDVTSYGTNCVSVYVKWLSIYFGVYFSSKVMTCSCPADKGERITQ